MNAIFTFSRISALGATLFLVSTAPMVADDTTRQAQASPLYLEQERVFVSYPEGWSAAKEANVYKLLNVPVEKQDILSADALEKIAQVIIFTERRKDHAEAVRRLREIEAETDSPATFLNIGGWPALQRRQLTPKPQPGPRQLSEESREMVLVITTAVAADSLLIRLEGRLQPNARSQIADQIEAIGRSLIFATAGDPWQVEEEIKALSTQPLVGHPVSTPVSKTSIFSKGMDAFSMASAEAPVRVTNTGGTSSELEIAVSTGGQNIVIGSNANYHFSIDGGRSFEPSAGIFGNDPSLAWGPGGGPDGTFYAANIEAPSTGIRVSTDKGANFIFRANAFTCSPTGPNACQFPDQEHIAADRFTAAGSDQVYSAWRHLDGRYAIVCSADSGMTWNTANFTAGDFPRITVGQDGFVYVIYKTSTTEIMLNKYQSCRNNTSMLPQAGFPTLVTMSAQDDTCPTPGLDRCGGKNVLNGPMVAVDDKDARHIYVAYAVNTEFEQNTSLANDNIVVQDSIDGGNTWSTERRVTVSGTTKGRRFMPWICAVDGTAHVSWYDRRAATAENNDLTDYFRGSASLNNEGNLLAGPDVQVNQAGTADAQCAIGWPGSVFAPSDSDSCSMQPQLAGFCSVSGLRCDFDQLALFGCPAQETCVATGGLPKYGDYNGNACAAGRLYLAWASATPPGSGGIDIFFALESPFRSDVSVTKSDSLDPVRVGDQLTYTVTFVNNGPDVAFGETLTDTLPAGVSFESASGGCTETDGTVTCNFGNLGSGTTALVEIVVTPTVDGTIINTARVSAQDPDPDETNNTAVEITTVKTTVKPPIFCGGFTPTKIGTPGRDIISGTDGQDIIHGLGGDDTIFGRGGNDTICGGVGNDVLFGQQRNDALNGGGGSDSCNGGRGENTAVRCERVVNVP